ncbi:hypothetical protein K439DRAFT_1379550 [Ramaria rubella]|nr:hypothetical protein K439DRAFT_1379550 [Ramaria rubella]
MASSLHAAESRLTELYADQSRMEEDIAARMEIAEKLRSQVRDLEKEKREAARRYTEQTATFEAERQALYDNEQHLKSRIQSLMAARKAQQEAAERPVSPVPSIAPSVEPSEAFPTSPTTPIARTIVQDDSADTSDGPEITALKLELSTLSTSHTSLQTMVHMLQTELTDLKRVNHELQEENESYGLLLMERAMNGTSLDMLRHMGGDEPSSSSGTVNFEDERNTADEGERASLRSTGRSMLDRVSEDEEFALEQQHKEQSGSLASELQVGQGLETHTPSRRRRVRQNSGSSSTRGAPVGETLADLPITGPGLDLAAELGRAETKDILEGNVSIGIDSQSSPLKSRTSRKVSDVGMDFGKDAGGEVDALRQEVKSLKDANKALSLYASKIIDRIIMQEGFEHVLSVDYDPEKVPPTPKSPGAFEEVLARAKTSPIKPKAPSNPKVRPQSMLPGRSSSVNQNNTPNLHQFPTSGEPEKLTTFNTPSPAADVKRNRRSLSFDWKSFSMFGGGGNAPPDSKEKNLRPLTLRPGVGSALSGARKLDSHEDEDDRKERERLQATMKLMGIEKPPEESSAPLIVKTQSDPAASDSGIPESSISKPASNRFSFFRSKSFTPASTPTSSAPPPISGPASLTSEALEQAEAETTLASLDAREKVLTAEIAKGGSGGFTELAEGRVSIGDQWRSRRTRSASGKSHDSSGASTVWSAGMKGDDE